MKLIEKDALVAEIEKLYNGEIDTYTRNILDRLKSNIDTLEVKDVDLEKEIDDYMAKEWEGIEEDKHFYGMVKTELSDIARHFFELGLKVAQKGE